VATILLLGLTFAGLIRSRRRRPRSCGWS
jgi:hypothetical protein